MKKTRFFFRKSFFFLGMCLAWLLLLNEAVSVTLGELGKKEMDREDKPSAQETGALSSSQNAPSLEETKKEEIFEEPSHTEQPLTIRVLLMDSGFTSYLHPEVRLLCQGKEYTFTEKSQALQEGEVTLEGGQEGITLLSVTRQEGNPVYSGSLTLKKEEGGILLVNELPLEEYLKGVIPSEMPASYHEEALKAQAVCARTYALRQLLDGSLKEYGADVDDSVQYQVYQNLSPREETSRAVEETKGLVLTQRGEPIQAYYFSTSSGMTSTDEVWGAVEAAAYLKSVPCSFDGDEPFSSWSVTLPWTSLEERAKALTGSKGALVSLAVTKRSESQAALSLEVVTEEGRTTVSGEYDIRRFLSPEGLTLTQGNGNSITGGSLLPSAYFTMEVNPGAEVRLTGRGYGHGVGMSQTAADKMAREGYSFQEILNYFYQNVTLEDAQTIYTHLTENAS